jgi:hypothetical protein
MAEGTLGPHSDLCFLVTEHGNNLKTPRPISTYTSYATAHSPSPRPRLLVCCEANTDPPLITLPVALPPFANPNCRQLVDTRVCHDLSNTRRGRASSWRTTRDIKSASDLNCFPSALFPRQLPRDCLQPQPRSCPPEPSLPQWFTPLRTAAPPRYLGPLRRRQS